MGSANLSGTFKLGLHQVLLHTVNENREDKGERKREILCLISLAVWPF